MKKITIFFYFILLLISSKAQLPGDAVGNAKTLADTTQLSSRRTDGRGNELAVINSTKDSTGGVFTNRYLGLGYWRHSRFLNDSTFNVGGDILSIPKYYTLGGGTGTGGGDSLFGKQDNALHENRSFDFSTYDFDFINLPAGDQDNDDLISKNITTGKLGYIPIDYATPWKRSTVAGQSATFRIVQTKHLYDTVITYPGNTRIYTSNKPKATVAFGGTTYHSGTATFDSTNNQIFLTGASGSGIVKMAYDGVHALNFSGPGIQGYTMDGPLVLSGAGSGIQTGSGALLNFFAPSMNGLGTTAGGTFGALAIGGATTAFRIGLADGNGATLTSTNSYTGVAIGGQAITEASTNTHPIIAQLSVLAPNITNGGATTTDVPTVYVGPPSAFTGSTNTPVSLWLDAGIQRYSNVSAAPSSIANSALTYAESGELKVVDDAGNRTTLSPHDPKGLPGGFSNKMAWSYYSENDRLNKYIAVDMYKAIRTIEYQSAEIEELKKEVAELKGMIYKKKQPVKLIHTGKIK